MTVLALLALSAQATTTIAPVSPLPGDTAARVQVFSDVPGAKLKVRAERGRVGDITPVTGGWLVEYLPPPVTESTLFSLEATVRGSGGVREETSRSVEVVPPWSGTLQVGFDAESVRAGESAAVRVTPQSRTPQATGRALRLSASMGEVTALVPSGDGSWVGRYTAPADLNAPAQAAIFAVDAAAPALIVGAAALPVTVQRSVTLDAPAGSSNILVVGRREVGPVSATPGGTVSFDVELHPAYRQGTLRTVAADGTRADTTVDLPIQAGPAVVVAPQPPSGPAQGSLALRAWGVGPDGRVLGPGDVTATAQRGSVGDLRSPTPGHLVWTWTLPEDGEDSVRLAAGEFASEATLRVVPAPVTVGLATDPATLGPDVRELHVVARVKDLQGTAIVGRPPALVADGASLSGTLADQGDGTYTQTARVNRGATEVRLAASADLAASGLPAYRLHVWPSGSVPADGTSSVDVLLAVEDALGLPVPGVELTLSVPEGDGSVPPKVTTGADGAVRTRYHAGTTPGIVAIAATGGGLTAATGLRQGPGAPILPAGSSARVAAVERWSASLPALIVSPPAPRPVAAVVSDPATTTPPVTTTAVTPADPVARVAANPTMTTTSPSRAPGVATMPRGRVRLALADAPIQYSSELEGGADEYAPRASFSVTPFFGAVALEPTAEVWLGSARTWGLDLRARATIYRVRVGDDTFTALPPDVHAGVRYRFWSSGRTSAYGGLGAHYTTGTLFAYANDARTAAELVDYPIVGGRLAAGLRYENDALLVDLQAAETFGPFPVITRGDLTVDVPLSAPVDLTLGAAVEYRSMEFSVGDDAQVGIGQLAEDLRVGVTLPL